MNGRLEVCVNELWGTVCGTSFTDEMAGIACAAMNMSKEGEWVYVRISTNRNSLDFKA